MVDRKQIAEPALVSWRAKVADGLAGPVSERTRLEEDDVRALIGAAFFALATYYVIGTIVRGAKRARG